MADTSYAEFYRRSVDSPESFWAEQAQAIDWHRPWHTVLDRSKPPFAAWFAGGDGVITMQTKKLIQKANLRRFAAALRTLECDEHPAHLRKIRTWRYGSRP